VIYVVEYNDQLHLTGGLKLRAKQISTQPLTLADRIERMNRALTAKELARIFAVSHITVSSTQKLARFLASVLEPVYVSTLDR